MHILIATDAEWIIDEITAAVGGPDVRFSVVGEGRHVADVVAADTPDLVITDLQVGTMGGMAVTMSLRLDESAGSLAHVPVMMLLDRSADVYLAQRSQAESWLVKPLDALRIQRAVHDTIAGSTFQEGVERDDDTPDTDSSSAVGEAETETADAG